MKDFWFGCVFTLAMTIVSTITAVANLCQPDRSIDSALFWVGLALASALALMLIIRADRNELKREGAEGVREGVRALERLNETALSLQEENGQLTDLRDRLVTVMTRAAFWMYWSGSENMRAASRDLIGWVIESFRRGAPVTLVTTNFLGGQYRDMFRESIEERVGSRFFNLKSDSYWQHELVAWCGANITPPAKEEVPPDSPEAT